VSHFASAPVLDETLETKLAQLNIKLEPEKSREFFQKLTTPNKDQSPSKKTKKQYATVSDLTGGQQISDGALLRTAEVLLPYHIIGTMFQSTILIESIF